MGMKCLGAKGQWNNYPSLGPTQPWRDGADNKAKHPSVRPS